METHAATSFPSEFLEQAGPARSAEQASGARRRHVEARIFAAAADLLAETIENPGDVEPRTAVTIDLEEPSLDLLQRAFASEFLFLRDAYGWLLRAVEVEVEPAGAEGHRLRARLEGECLDPERHHRIVERGPRLVSSGGRSGEPAGGSGLQTSRKQKPRGQAVEEEQPAWRQERMR